jgi:mono/diheme cytochrome c family protein
MRINQQCAVVLAFALGLVVAVSAWGQAPMQHKSGDKSSTGTAPVPIRTTMDALHASGGVPKGWRFLVPPGDPADGREAFVTLECFACHAVKGEAFPKTSKRPQGPGPELTAMGAHHPSEYFAESIVNPNRVIVQGAGYTGQDGLSKMPDYGDVMTVRQLVDLVAYLKSLKAEMGHHGGDKPMRGEPMDMKGHGMK